MARVVSIVWNGKFRLTTPSVSFLPIKNGREYKTAIATLRPRSYYSSDFHCAKNATNLFILNVYTTIHKYTVIYISLMQGI